jgi:hypothetical protein
MSEREQDQWISNPVLRRAAQDAATYCIPRYVCNAYGDQYLKALESGTSFRFSLLEWRRWWWGKLERGERRKIGSAVRMALVDPAGAFEDGNVAVAPACRQPADKAAAVARCTATRNANGCPRGSHLRVRGEGHPRSRAVVTPDGRFGSVALASEAAGITRQAGHQRVRAGQWEYAE